MKFRPLVVLTTSEEEEEVAAPRKQVAKKRVRRPAYEMKGERSSF